MNRQLLLLTTTLMFLVGFLGFCPVSSADESKKLVIVAGKPSHPPGMHEFNAGVSLLVKCLDSVAGVEAIPVLNGWPEDESVFDGADAIVFYMDGRGKHEIVQEDGRRLKLIDQWVAEGVSVGFMHYSVEVLPEQAGSEMMRWIGGHYENSHSCNPIWEPVFAVFPDHPITSGVKPFRINDEWYFNIRFVADIVGNEPKEIGETKFQPILLATPSAEVRGGPYVHPKGPFAHIQASAGRAEAMMWAIERPDGGRGFGFTGGHFHDNWGNDDYRKVVLNALVWAAKAEVPENGVESNVTAEMLDQNLDLKPIQKKKKKKAKKKEALSTAG